MGLLAGGNRPSYFEMFAQELIVTSLRPALQFATAVLAPRFPLLFRTQRWTDEIFAVLLGVLEWAHLRTKDAGFAESFFALKRVRYFPPRRAGEGAGAAIQLAAAGGPAREPRLHGGGPVRQVEAGRLGGEPGGHGRRGDAGVSSSPVAPPN
eukprot:COSAG01_NODE_385_length_17743_cov_20.528622_5_plen_152_part_00